MRHTLLLQRMGRGFLARHQARLRRRVLSWAVNWIGEWWRGCHDRVAARKALAQGRRAATAIQTFCRGLLARRLLARLRLQFRRRTQAASRIQRVYRAWLARSLPSSPSSVDSGWWWFDPTQPREAFAHLQYVEGPESRSSKAKWHHAVPTHGPERVRGEFFADTSQHMPLERAQAIAWLQQCATSPATPSPKGRYTHGAARSLRQRPATAGPHRKRSRSRPRHAALRLSLAHATAAATVPLHTPIRKPKPDVAPWQADAATPAVDLSLDDQPAAVVTVPVTPSRHRKPSTRRRRPHSAHPASRRQRRRGQSAAPPSRRRRSVNTFVGARARLRAQQRQAKKKQKQRAAQASAQSKQQQARTRAHVRHSGWAGTLQRIATHMAGPRHGGERMAWEGPEQLRGVPRVETTQLAAAFADRRRSVARRAAVVARQSPSALDGAALEALGRASAAATRVGPGSARKAARVAREAQQRVKRANEAQQA